jgi:hypothetical protein
MNFDPAVHPKHQQSNPTTPQRIPTPGKIGNSMRSSNNGISPNKVMQMNDAAMSISNHVSNSMSQRPGSLLSDDNPRNKRASQANINNGNFIIQNSPY